MYNRAWEYLKGKCSVPESAYPYTAGTTKLAGSCKNLPTSQCVLDYTNLEYTSVNGNTNAIETAVVKTPLSIAVAANDSWQSYSSGIVTISACPDAQLNHAVQLTGYGPGYWTVRNSWGANWGESGFIRLEKGDDTNTCGL